MKRIRLVGLALIAVFAFGALTASSAFAEEGPEISPGGTEKAPITFTAKNNGKTFIESTSGKKVECNVAEAKGEFTSASKGLVLIDFKECKSSTVSCNSPEDAAGVILTLLNMRLVSVLPGGTLDLGVLLEPKAEPPVTGDLAFTCGVIFKAKVLDAVIGVMDNSAGALLKLKEPSSEFKLLWKAEKTGEQEIKKCDTPKESCEGISHLLETEFLGAHELSALIADATLTFTKKVEFTNF